MTFVSGGGVGGTATVSRGIPCAAAIRPVNTAASPIARLENASNADFMWLLRTARIARLVPRLARSPATAGAGDAPIAARSTTAITIRPYALADGFENSIVSARR